MNLALIGIAVILMHWPHVKLPMSFMEGFPVVGWVPASGVYAATDKTFVPITVQELEESSPSLIARIMSSTPKEEAAGYIREACEKDRLAGFASGYFTKEELDEKFGVGKWVPLPTFDHEQSTGKHRRIDNGLLSMHNAATAFGMT